MPVGLQVLLIFLSNNKYCQTLMNWARVEIKTDKAISFSCWQCARRNTPADSACFKMKILKRREIFIIVSLQEQRLLSPSNVQSSDAYREDEIAVKWQPVPLKNHFLGPRDITVMVSDRLTRPPFSFHRSFSSSRAFQLLLTSSSVIFPQSLRSRHGRPWINENRVDGRMGVRN